MLPQTTKREFNQLKKELEKLFEIYPYTPQECDERTPTIIVSCETKKKEWVELHHSQGKICAGDCGLFPPCTPLIRAGERIEKDKIVLLEKAANVYGLVDKKILVVKEEE